MPTEHSAKPTPLFANRGRGNFDLILALFVVVLILSNIGATKGIQFGPLVTDGGAFLFPLAYILGDVISEVYGFRAARRAIFIGFGTSVFASFSFWLVIIAPAAEFYSNQAAFEAVLGFVPLIVLGSLLGYLVGQLTNSWVLVAIKQRNQNGPLWWRLIASTGVGELVDTIIFCGVAATVIGISTWQDFLNYVVVGYVYKVAVEIILLPITYRVIKLVRKHEDITS